MFIKPWKVVDENEIDITFQVPTTSYENFTQNNLSSRNDFTTTNEL
jgi:hypothetical protein